LLHYPISEQEIYKVLTLLGCNFSQQYPDDPIYLYSQDLKLQCYNDLVTLFKDPDCDINLNSFILPEIGNIMRYPNELIKITMEEFLHRDSEDIESANYSLDLNGAAKYTVLTLFSHMSSYIYEEFLDVSGEFLRDFLPIELVDRYGEGDRGKAIFREMVKVGIVLDNEDYSGGVGGYSKNLCVVKRFDV
jgi:hypothetical protein